MRHHELGPEEEPGVENINYKHEKLAIDSYLSKKREVGFILFLDLLLPPLFHTIPNIGLETEAKSDNRIPNTRTWLIV